MLKTVASITNAIGALNYKGTWNASTNSPALASSVGTKGDYYVVSVAGTTSLDGISNWGVGDWAVFNGSVWQRVEGGADLNGVNLSVSGNSDMGNIRVAGNTISSTNTNGDVALVPNGTGGIDLNGRKWKKATIALSADGTYQLAVGGGFSGSMIISWFGNGRIEYREITFSANAFDNVAHLSITNQYSYQGNVVLSNFRVSADTTSGNVNRYVLVDVANRNGSTGNMTVYAFGVDPALLFNPPNIAAISTVGTATGRDFVFTPLTNNSIQLGSTTYRWSEVYASNGTINTSDGNQKTDVQMLSDAEHRVAVRLKLLIRTFKFVDAVASKGAEARIHVGVIAQDVEQAFIAEGLDPRRYGLFCEDTWYEYNGIPLTKNDAGEYPEDLISQSVKVTQLGVRYSELLAFIIAAL